MQISAKQSSEGVSSGVIVMGWDYARLGLVKKEDGFILQFVTCTDAEQGGQEKVTDITAIAPTRVYAAGLKPNLECDLWLRIDVKRGGECTFLYSTDGKKYIPAGRFKARAGKWIGAKMGFYSVAPNDVPDKGWIDVITSDITVK